MNRRKLFSIALLVAIPFALAFSLRAARSWQPRVTELGATSFDDATDLFWRANGLTLATYSEIAPRPPLALRNWDGARVTMRALPAQSAALDRSGTLAARLFSPAGASTRVELWDVTRRRPLSAVNARLFQGKNRRAHAVCSALSPDGSRVAWDGLKPYGVIIADTTSGRELARFAVPAGDGKTPIDAREVLTLAWSRDGNQLAVAGSTYLAIVDAANGQLRHLWRKPESFSRSIAWSPDGKTLALASGRGPMFIIDGPIGGPETPIFLRLCDVRTGRVQRSWSHPVSDGAQAQGVTNLDFSSDGQRLAWGTHDGHALVMNLSSGAIENRFGLQISPDTPPWSGPQSSGFSSSAQYVAWSPDARTLAIVSRFQIVLRRMR